MKILETGKQQAIQSGTGSTREKSAAEGVRFGIILENELQSGAGFPSKIGTETKVASPGLQAALVGLDTDTRVWDRQAFDAVSASLGKLEDVQRSLSDQGLNPKKLDEVIGSLSSEVDTLQENLKTLPEDHPLRQIGDELKILIYVESLKWSRGDYL